MSTAPPVPSRVAVVVLNYNGFDDTMACLRSLGQVTTPLTVILVDNASEVDPTDEGARVYSGLVAIRTSENLGYAGGNNRGIEKALELGAEFVLVLNNDTVVAPEIVNELVAALDGNPSRGIVGPVVNFLDEPDAVMTDGVAFNPGPGLVFFQRIVVPPRETIEPPVEVDIVNGCCMMIRAEVFRQVGLFDERFFIVHEESDFCLRAKRGGFSNWVLGRSLVWHKGSSSFERSGRQLQRYFDARNLLKLLSRHTGRVSRSRSLAPSVWRWARYVFYRYDVEIEAGKERAGLAAIDGFYDGLRGWEGPYRSRRRLGIGALRLAFRAGRGLSGLKRRAGGPERRKTA